ncbi:hypothetical protein BV20DRAFT_257795 [Pilatotrama ljubarskyi]|nr:hypothetical protein BV20DRAFT_257795 [Pilatotrama ljubarskyi]
MRQRWWWFFLVHAAAKTHKYTTGRSEPWLSTCVHMSAGSCRTLIAHLAQELVESQACMISEDISSAKMEAGSA